MSIGFGRIGVMPSSGTKRRRRSVSVLQGNFARERVGKGREKRTYVDTKAYKDVPNGMACHTGEIESTGIHFFRESLSIYE
jgi:hypothetical protein